MICDFCQGKTEAKNVKKHHWYKKRLYIIENVKADVCIQCGERYYHATTLDAIDRLLESDHKVKDRFEVEVVDM